MATADRSNKRTSFARQGAGVGALALTLAMSSLSPAPGFQRAAQQCSGRRATITGTSADDVLEGTNRRDVIAGGRGADRINGRDGNDLICGGPGRDRLAGGGSHGTEPWEHLHGGRGTDTLFFVDSLSANVFLRARGPKRGGFYKAGPGNLARVIGIENVRGTRYADRLRGDAAANRLRGRKGPDTLHGRRGDDVLSGGHGTDTADGGRGTDSCRTAEESSSCE